MKLIINILEDVYTRLFDNGIQDNEIAVDDVCEMARALRIGIPLDTVKAEIEQGICTAKNDYDKGRNYGLYMATQILDNINKAEKGGEANV